MLAFMYQLFRGEFISSIPGGCSFFSYCFAYYEEMKNYVHFFQQVPNTNQYLTDPKQCLTNTKIFS